MRCLGRNLAKDVQELYTGYYKAWLREMKEGLNKWREIEYLWVGRFTIAKMVIPPKLIC